MLSSRRKSQEMLPRACWLACLHSETHQDEALSLPRPRLVTSVHLGRATNTTRVPPVLGVPACALVGRRKHAWHLPWISATLSEPQLVSGRQRRRLTFISGLVTCVFFLFFSMARSLPVLLLFFKIALGYVSSLLVSCFRFH